MLKQTHRIFHEKDLLGQVIFGLTCNCGGHHVFENFDSPAKSYSVQHFTTHKTKWNIKVSIFCEHFLVPKNEMF